LMMYDPLMAEWTGYAGVLAVGACAIGLVALGVHVWRQWGVW